MTEYQKWLATASEDEIFKVSEPEKFDMEDTPYTKTEIGPTPNGGAFSRAYFYDKDMKPCVREDARFINIVEYDKDFHRVNETYGKIGS